MNKEIANELVKISNQIQQKITDMAPVAKEAAFAVYRINCFRNIIFSLLCIAISICCLYFIRWFYKNDIDGDFIVPFLYVASIIAGLLGLFELFDMYNYIGIFHPELVIAHDIIEKVKS